MGCHDSGRGPPGLAVSASCASFLLPAPVSFRSRRRRVPGQHPLSRVSHVRARLRLRRRGFARLIARARAKRKAHFSCPFLGAFFAPARNRRRSGLRMPLRPVSFYHGFFRVKPYSGIISPEIELVRQVGRSCPDRPPVEPVPPRGDAFGQRLLGPAGERASAGARPGRRESRLRRARRSAAKVCGSATASRSSPPRSADGPMTGGFEAAPVPCEPPACGNGNDREARTLLPLSTSCY